MSGTYGSALRRTVAALGLAMVVAALGLAAASPAAAGGSVQPLLNCYFVNPDGTYTVSLGYRNSAGALTIPVGPQNYVSPGQQNWGQPTVFQAGTQSNVWTPTVTQAQVYAGTNWVVQGHQVELAGGEARQCSSRPVPAAGSAAAVLSVPAVAIAFAWLTMRTRRRRVPAAGGPKIVAAQV